MTEELGTSCPFCGKWIDDMMPSDVKDIEDEYEGEKLEYCPIHFHGVNNHAMLQRHDVL